MWNLHDSLSSELITTGQGEREHKEVCPVKNHAEVNMGQMTKFL